MTIEEEKRHSIFAISEWHILSQADWLFSGGGSSFSETAAGVGLGPVGGMERFTFMDGFRVGTVNRRDWENDPCSDEIRTCHH